MHDVGVGHGVVHQAAGEQLAGFGVVGHLLAQGLADALHRAAVKLTAHDGRVDHPAHVIDRAVGHQLHIAGGRVDLDFAHMTAIGPGGPTDLGGGGQVHAAIGLALRQLTQAQADVGALDLKAPSLVGQVVARHFQCFGGQLTRLRQAALRALFDRRATGEQGARTCAAKAVAAVGVAQHNAHLR